MRFVGVAERPEHAAKIGEIVAVSGFLENRLGSLLAVMTGGSAAVTVAMFSAVGNMRTQRDVLEAAAQIALPPEDLAVFTALMREFKPRYNERSRIVHGIWGVADEFPDKLIRCESAAITRMWEVLADIDDMPSAEAAAAATANLWRNCETWTVKDLEQVRSRLSAYEGSFSEMWGRLHARRFPVSEPSMTGPKSPRPSG